MIMQNRKVVFNLFVFIFSSISVFGQEAVEKDDVQKQSTHISDKSLVVYDITTNDVEAKNESSVIEKLKSINGVVECRYNQAERKIFISIRKVDDFASIETIKSVLSDFQIEINKYTEVIY